MPLPFVLLPLVVMMPQAVGEAPVRFGDLSVASKQEIIDTHNSIRRTVQPAASNMVKMEWSESSSQNANKSVGRCQETISHPIQRIIFGVACGENLLTSPHPISWTKVIQKWNEKRSFYKYGIGPISGRYESDVYTQLIWYNSFLVGCAHAFCPKNNAPYVYACQYCPAGNIVQKLKYPYKAGKPCEECPDKCENKLCTNPCRYTDKIRGCDILKKMTGCNGLMPKHCQATCKCQTEIL